MPARTACRARNRCAFTVPSFIPVTAAISSRSMSSTKRSRKTVRCLSENRRGLPYRFALVLSPRRSSSGDRCRSGTQSLTSARSRSERSDAPPEFQAAACLVIANQIGGDLHQPRDWSWRRPETAREPCRPSRSIPGSGSRPIPCPVSDASMKRKIRGRIALPANRNHPTLPSNDYFQRDLCCPARPATSKAVAFAFVGVDRWKARKVYSTGSEFSDCGPVGMFRCHLLKPGCARTVFVPGSYTLLERRAGQTGGKVSKAGVTEPCRVRSGLFQVPHGYKLVDETARSLLSLERRSTLPQVINDRRSQLSTRRRDAPSNAD